MEKHVSRTNQDNRELGDDFSLPTFPARPVEAAFMAEASSLARVS
jgi:hypothetical protein